MGGGTAVELAVTEPGRVDSLTLLCPAIGDCPYPDEPELDTKFAALAAAGDDDGLARLARRVWAAAGDNPVITDLMRSAVRGWQSDRQWQQEGEPTIRAPKLVLDTILACCRSGRDRPDQLSVPGRRLAPICGPRTMSGQRWDGVRAYHLGVEVRA